MDESKELQQMYTILRTTIYLLLLMEFLVYVPFPFMAGLQETWVGSIMNTVSQFLIYENLVYSRLAILLITCVCSIGTKAKKDLEFDPTKMVAIPFILGLILTLLSIFIYPHLWSFRLFSMPGNFTVYMFLGFIGTIMMHIALDNISKSIKHGLMKDRMNWENESFMQETKKITSKDAINIPTLFYYKGKMNKGWINIEQPFRGIWVVGVPGSGKTFSIIEPLIRQESAKGWSMCVYDYKFPVLARKLFYHFEKNKALGNLPKHATFNVINFVDVEYSRRVNPIQNHYINTVGEASETAVTLMEALQKGKSGGGGSDDFFKKAAENFLAACIYFFVNHDIRPYDKEWNILHEVNTKDKHGDIIHTDYYYTDFDKNGNPIVDTSQYDEEAFNKLVERWQAEGKLVRDINRMDWKKNGRPAELYRYKGRYADLPHVLSFILLDYSTIFDVLMTEEKVDSLVAPFVTAYTNKAMDQLEGMVGTLRIYVTRLVTQEAYWVLSGDDFDLKISDPKNPSYLLIANDPKMESIITALNAVILNRLVSEVNTGEGKNNPVSIIVDELPTLYFNKIDRLQGTARSNKVSIALGFQSKEQLEKDYGKEVTAALLGIFGTVVSAATNNKDTVEWISNDVMGKIKQLKEGLSVTRDQTTLSLNEELQPLVPPDKISNMPAGWLCGTAARSFTPLDIKKDGSIKIDMAEDFKPVKFFAKTNFDMAAIKDEEAHYVELPKFYTFRNEREKQELLAENFRKIRREVDEVCQKVLSNINNKDGNGNGTAPKA